MWRRSQNRETGEQPAFGVMAAALGPGLLDPCHLVGEVALIRLDAVGHAVWDVEDRTWLEGNLLAVDGRRTLTADDIYLAMVVVPCHDRLTTDGLVISRQREPARQA